MKKARFIGVLMAAVMAAVPFTANTAKNFNIGFNSIETNANGTLNEARRDINYGYHINEANNQGIILHDFTYGMDVCCLTNSSTNDSGGYCLHFKNGILSIRRSKKGRQNIKNEFGGCTPGDYYNIFYFNTGGDELAFQLDGNLVAYDSKTGRPTAQTRTASMYKSTNQGYTYQYILTNDGRLLIYRYYPGSHWNNRGAFKGKYEIIWDSSKDKMYRI